MGDMEFDKEAGRAILVNIKNRIKIVGTVDFKGWTTSLSVIFHTLRDLTNHGCQIH